MEAITNIRTLAGLQREALFLENYKAELVEPHKQAKRTAHYRGVVFGFAQAIPFFTNATCMCYGAYLVENGEIAYQSVYK